MTNTLEKTYNREDQHESYFLKRLIKIVNSTVRRLREDR